MNALKPAVVVSLCLVTPMMATDGHVSLGVYGIAYDSLFNPLPDLYLGPATTHYINWHITVEVTGNNRGLGGFLIDLGIKGRDGSFLSGDAKYSMPAGMWTANVYNVPGPGGPGTVVDAGKAGGPGMNIMPTTGTPTLVARTSS